MSSPVEEVLAFFKEWATPATTREAFQRRFTADTVWENVGLARTVGGEEAVAFMDGFNTQMEIARGEVIVDHIAAVGNVVLNERTDIFYRADGSVVASIKLMGILEMDGPRIKAWRDYFDTKAFAD